MSGPIQLQKHAGEAKIPLDETRIAEILEILDAMPFYAMLVDEEHCIVAANRVVQQSVQLSRDEIVGQYCPKLIHQTDGPFPGCPVEACCQTDEPTESEQYDPRYGIWLRSMAYPTRYRSAEGRRVFLHFARDITEHKIAEKERDELQAQLNRSQRMEAVGRLAGGIAHDFNNMLTAILNFAQFVDEDLPEAEPAREDVAEIIATARRAAALTRQLLALSRRDVAQREVVDLNRLVENLTPMLRGLAGGGFELRMELDPSLPRALIDVSQLEHVLVNLVANGRDAMVDGGALTIRTRTVSIPSNEVAASVDLPDGRYASVALIDAGAGMSPETLEHVFEPFFTTKDAQKGTGLGLATAYGIVRQAGGTIVAESALGAGSTFTIYLPATDKPLRTTSPRVSDQVVQGAGQIVLIVDDDPAVRDVARRILGRAGYSTRAAAGSVEAMAFAEEAQGCDLVLSDVVMTDGSGTKLADRLRAAHPRARVVFMSGYADESVAAHGLPQDAHFIRKPFDEASLLRTVADALADPPSE